MLLQWNLILRDHNPMGHTNDLMWSLKTGSSIALKCRTFCQENLVFQDRWSFMAVVSQGRFYCISISRWKYGKTVTACVWVGDIFIYLHDHVWFSASPFVPNLHIHGGWVCNKLAMASYFTACFVCTPWFDIFCMRVICLGLWYDWVCWTLMLQHICLEFNPTNTTTPPPPPHWQPVHPNLEEGS